MRTASGTAEPRDDRARLVETIACLEELVACYRLRRPPSIRLLERLERVAATRERLAEERRRGRKP